MNDQQLYNFANAHPASFAIVAGCLIVAIFTTIIVFIIRST